MRESEMFPNDSSTDPSSEPVIAVENRRVVPLRFLPPCAILLVAVGLLVYRSQIADFRGLHLPKLPKFVAAPQPAPIPAQAAKKTKTDTPPTPAPAKVAKEVDKKAWDEIEREAERKRAEIAELERLKEDADKKAESQPPRIAASPFPGRFGRALTPQEREQFLRAQREFQRRHFEQFAQLQQAMIEQQQAMIAQFENDFRGLQRPPMMPFPGFPGANAPIPDGQPFTMRWEIRVNGQRVDGGEIHDQPGFQPRTDRRNTRRDRSRVGS
jgi:hypothetical protein